VTRRDARDFDLIIGMDGRNMRSLRSMLGPDAYDRIHLLLEYAGSLDDIADPWYTGDFETTFDDVMRGCTGLLAKLTGGK
jgi:protein-tyrosine phosphatase